MANIYDEEFGEIRVRTHHAAKRVSMRIAPDGILQATIPKGSSNYSVTFMLRTARAEIRKLVNQHSASTNSYDHSQSVGKSHSLVVETGSFSSDVKKTGTKIIAKINLDDNIRDHKIQALIREQIIKALRKEAKSYLPRRLAFIAKEHGFHYSSVRLSHAGSRWGSCSSNGTISLNIALMNLPFALLDYVLYHELSHTRQMNHSKKFWNEVANLDKDYEQHRRELKQYTPNI